MITGCKSCLQGSEAWYLVAFRRNFHIRTTLFIAPLKITSYEMQMG